MRPEFLRAMYQTSAHRERVDVVVIHTTETPCVSGMALRIAQGFAEGNRKASAHYIVDPGNIIQCVHEHDVAWHCPGANRRGIGIEHAGFTARPTPTDWLHDQHAAGMLELSAELVAGICERWNIPVVHLTPAELAVNHRGIVSHADATEAFQTTGGHVDGSTWPWDSYLAAVARWVGKSVRSNQ
jgi:N-acetyl-anhydromuramyl-L-alanine amidase AmpD